MLQLLLHGRLYSPQEYISLAEGLAKWLPPHQILLHEMPPHQILLHEMLPHKTPSHETPSHAPSHETPSHEIPFHEMHVKLLEPRQPPNLKVVCVHLDLSGGVGGCLCRPVLAQVALSLLDGLWCFEPRLALGSA